MPTALIDLVRSRIPKGFAREVGSRGQFQGPCPACGGTDRFCVFPDQEPKGDLAVRAGAWGGYWCQQCGLAGDYVQWLVEVEGWDWTKIFEFLGVEGERPPQWSLPPVRREQPGQRIGRELDELEPYALPPQEWREHAEKFVAASAANLEKNPKLIEWLKGRGVSLGVAKEYLLGWHAGEPQRGGRPPCAYRNREGWGLEPQMNENGKPKSIWLPRGLVIPNYRGGDLLAVRIRRPGGDAPGGQGKYKLVVGSMNACMITLNARVYVVEEAGLDGLTVLSAGVEGVGMCAMGSLSAYPDKGAAEHLQRAELILQTLDFEPQGKGEKYGNKFRHWWQVRFPQCRRAPVPIGKDPGEFVEQAGLEGMRAWLESQLPAGQLSHLAPKGKIERAPQPPSDVRLPEPVQQLYGILASRGGYIVVSSSGNYVGSQVPGDDSLKVYYLAAKKVVREWLSQIDPTATGAVKVTRSNFMTPIKGGR